MIFLRHHLDEGLKNEYLTIKDPLVLWKNLKERYDHQKTVLLPKARYDWMHLRLQDFRIVAEYNSALFKISSKLQLCGEKIIESDMLEKTYSTFHALNVLLQQQYRERRFAKYSELISYLLVAEQNNELLLQNHQSRPTGSTSIPEVNVTSSSGCGRSRGRGRGRGSGHWCGRGRGQNNYQSRGGHINIIKNHKKWSNNIARQGKKQFQPPANYENKCYKCGMKGHWSCICYMADHLIKFYQTSLKEKIETNLIDGDDPVDITHLNVSDFFEDPNGKIDHLIGVGNVLIN